MTDSGHPSPRASDDDLAPAVPPVVAVVVTCDPGPWLEETLAALGAQDYPDLSVLVLDAGSEEDPTGRIAAVLPSAFVRRLERNDGFGPSANDVLAVVEGASHYLFLHDDAAADPDAVRILVEEAYRSNAGVVAPKLVAWDDEMRLLAVGATIDKSGHLIAYGRGELDQEQYDAVRDVFVAPGGCQLVRADLFSTIGGFSASMPFLGEDVDMSWRAQVAGARVVVAPGARVRHREAAAQGERDVPFADDGDLEQLRLRHRLRAVLVNYSRVHLARVLPQVIVVMLVEAAFDGRRGLRQLLDAWRWNLGSARDIRAARGALRAVRIASDSDIRPLQARAGGGIARALRGGLAIEERTLGVGAASREFVGVVSRGGLRLTIAVWLGLTAVLVTGGRHLLADIPAIGQFTPLPANPWDLVRLFIAGWHPAGVGSTGAPPFGFALLGGAGGLLFGGEQFVQKLAVLGMLPLGIIGMHRLAAPLGTWRPRLVAAVLYAAVPLPYDAFARGRWATLVAYGAMPWLIGRLLRATGIAPFGAPAEIEESAVRRRARRTPHVPADAVEALLGAEAGTLDQVDTEELRLAAIAVAGRHAEDDGGAVDAVLPPPAWVTYPGTFLEQVVPAAVVMALAAALAPSVALAVLLAATGLAVGFVVAGGGGRGGASLSIAIASVAGAAVLLLPWTIELLAPGSPWGGIAGLGVEATDAPGLGELVRFHLGRSPLNVLTIGLLVAAVLPLLVGRRWRIEWAARLWTLAVVSWLVAWTAGRGWLGVDPPAVDVLIVPAAVAVVLTAALGLTAFEIDLPGYRFGWRQFASVAAAVAGVVATVPVVATAVDGRWRMPSRDFAGVLSWMPEQVEAGDFRVLWVGAADSLPADGWRLTDGIAYAASRNGMPDLTAQWPGTDSGANGLLADALGVARRAETTRVGTLLAPLGVRYIAVPLKNAPAGQGALGHAPPAGLVDALRSQVDLRVIRSDDAIVLFENAVWRPVRTSGGKAALDPGSFVLESRGPVGDGVLYLAEAYSDRWVLGVDGRDAPQAKANGWANAFDVSAAGEGELRFRPPPLRAGVLVVVLGAWVLAIRTCVLTVRRRRAVLAATPQPPAAAEAGA